MCLSRAQRYSTKNADRRRQAEPARSRASRKNQSSSQPEATRRGGRNPNAWALTTAKHLQHAERVVGRGA